MRDSNGGGLPDISNNVGPVKHFLNALLSFHLKEFFSFALFRFLFFCIDDHGSFVIQRSASVRPKHLFDQTFDHDYFCKLPLQGGGCPIKCTVFYFPPFPVPGCPAYEPNSNDGEYSYPFRHIQYKRTASLRPIATLAMLLCRRIARWIYRRLQSGWIRAAAWTASTNKKRNKELPCLLMCPSRCLPALTAPLGSIANPEISARLLFGPRSCSIFTLSLVPPAAAVVMIGLRRK